MNAELAQREIALAAVALLAVVAVVAGLRLARDESTGGSSPSPAEIQWSRAVAAPYSFPKGAARTECGQPARSNTVGLAHPVLPCGAKIVIRFGGQEILTQVVDRGAGAPGREFGLTHALARLVGLSGRQSIEWRFAVPGDRG